MFLLRDGVGKTQRDYRELRPRKGREYKLEMRTDIQRVFAAREERQAATWREERRRDEVDRQGHPWTSTTD